MSARVGRVRAVRILAVSGRRHGGRRRGCRRRSRRCSRRRRLGSCLCRSAVDASMLLRRRLRSACIDERAGRASSSRAYTRRQRRQVMRAGRASSSRAYTHTSGKTFHPRGIGFFFVEFFFAPGIRSWQITHVGGFAKCANANLKGRPKLCEKGLPSFLS